jgi:hypothetical protein
MFPADLVPLDIPMSENASGQGRAWAAVSPNYEDWRALPDELETGAFRLAQATTGKPLLLSPLSPHARLDVHRQISEVWMLGLGTLTEGFPVAGRLNDDVVRASVVAQALSASLRLRQGRHVARQNILYQGSRINPVTIEARPIFEWIVDPDAEIRQVRVCTWRLPEPLYCEHLDLELVDGHSAIVVHAVSVR